jgi:ribose 5-phosphate isomerase B
LFSSLAAISIRVTIGSGVGAAVALNKISGVRAGLIEDHFSAKQEVGDDDLNVVCLGGRIEEPELVWDLIQTFLAVTFSHAPRHVRRLTKVAALKEPPTAKA